MSRCQSCSSKITRRRDRYTSTHSQLLRLRSKTTTLQLECGTKDTISIQLQAQLRTKFARQTSTATSKVPIRSQSPKRPCTRTSTRSRQTSPCEVACVNRISFTIKLWLSQMFKEAKRAEDIQTTYLNFNSRSRPSTR